jgi:hypothetical protein
VHHAQGIDRLGRVVLDQVGEGRAAVAKAHQRSWAAPLGAEADPHRQAGGAGSFHGHAAVLEVADHLEQEEVDAGLGLQLRGFAQIGGPGNRGELDAPVALVGPLRHRPHRRERACDGHGAPKLRRGPRRRLARQTHRQALELGGALADAGALEQMAGGGEGVGGHDVGAGADMVLMDAAQQVGMTGGGHGAPGVVVHRRTPALQLGARGAV